MMNKEILPKEVAEAIEKLRADGMNNYAIMVCAQHANCDESLLVIQDWAFECEAYSGKTDNLMNALVNGYEVEKTPEEKVREYYESIERWAKRMRERAGHAGESNALYELTGIETTLNKLGITIEGVNKEGKR